MIVGLLFVDSRKAFDSLKRDLLIYILSGRCKTDADKQFVNWIIMLMKETFIQLEDGSVF